MRLCDIVIRENVRKLFKLEEDFGRVIKKTKVNINFLFKRRYHLDRVEIKQQKVKREKLRSLSPNSVYKKLLIKRFYEHLPHFRFKLKLTLDHIMPGFIEKNKVPFNSFKNLVVNRIYTLTWRIMKERRSIVHAILLVVNYPKIILMILRLRRKLMITGLN